MGSWHLEVFKMTLYMAFPVGLFYYFNQPQYFEDHIVKIKKDIFPPDEKAKRREMEQIIKEHNERKSKEIYK